MDLLDCIEDDIRNENMHKNLDENIQINKGIVMEKERNLLLAKKYMVESIYRSANIEGIGMTFPETQTICDGMSIAGHSIDDINAINDLKNAWKWVFSHIDRTVDVESLCEINRLAGKFTVINAGTFRTVYDEPIRVPLRDGKNYYPNLPDKEQISKEIAKITREKSLESALDLFCYICKKQIFNDGNKRTATIYANMYMIQNGLGILSIPIDKKLEFYNALTAYYEEDKNKILLIDFLKDYCITGK